MATPEEDRRAAKVKRSPWTGKCYARPQTQAELLAESMAILRDHPTIILTSVTGDEPMTTPTKTKTAAPKTAKKTKAPRVTQRDKLLALLQQPGGASLVEITGELGILPHTARAYVSVESRKVGKKAVLAEGRYTLAD